MGESPGLAEVNERLRALEIRVDRILEAIEKKDR
jgi:hypothetical protein